MYFPIVYFLTYDFPPTEPLFLPIAVSNSTPAHSPTAKSVGPRYLRIPILVPPVALATITRAPIAMLELIPGENDFTGVRIPPGLGVLSATMLAERDI